MKHTVAIIGRPNVGKSTLFNRLAGQRKAIVDNTSGITRDRHYATCEWNGRSFTVVDTGGYLPKAEDVFEKAVKVQVETAMEQAAVILFVVDVTTGITDLDEALADLLRRSNKPVLTVVNKVDNTQRVTEATLFYRMGAKELFEVSALSGSGTGDLLDKVVEHLPSQPQTMPDDVPRLAILGKPNTGKSSLLNALTGQERHIVTDVPGTTRDSIHSTLNYKEQQLLLIDTAGLRKRQKVRAHIEFYANLRTINAVEEADVCALLIDANEGIGTQDLNILHLIETRRKGMVVVVNKWDLYKKSTNTAKQYVTIIQNKTAPFSDFPVVFISALTGQRIHKVLDEALEVHNRRNQKVPTSQLNRILLPLIEKQPPPAYRNHPVRIKYITQLQAAPPVFGFYANHPRQIKPAYRRFLEHALRKHFSFSGVPLTLAFKQK